MLIPETVWLVGKGPSLDYFDWDSITEDACVVCINETALIVPKCKIAVAGDQRIFEKYRKNLSKDIYVMCHPQRLIWPKQIIPIHMDGCLHGSASKAISNLIRLGAKHFILIGFDSLFDVGGWSEKICRINGQGLNKDHYVSINESILGLFKKHKECSYELFKG